MSAMLLIFIYFCAMFFGDVGHVAHLYIFLCYAQKYIKMSNMADITKENPTEIYKDEQH
jgi:hypothetical protein